MKIRTGFVSNSSSSSFICISAGDIEIYSSDDEDPGFDTDSMSLDIDTLIKSLQEAKEKGVTKLHIEYGGGYDS